MCHRLLETLGPAPLLRRPARAVRSDLVHRGVQLDAESVRIPDGLGMGRLVRHHSVLLRSAGAAIFCRWPGPRQQPAEYTATLRARRDRARLGITGGIECVRLPITCNVCPA